MVRGEPRLMIVAIRSVAAKDELTIDYGLRGTANSGDGAPIHCQCGARNCRQFLGAERGSAHSGVAGPPRKRRRFDCPAVAEVNSSVKAAAVAAAAKDRAERLARRRQLGCAGVEDTPATSTGLCVR